MTSIKQMVIEHLENIGADGLCNCNTECGCKIGDMFLCEMFDPDYCVAGWEGKPRYSEFTDETDWRMYPSRKAAEESEEE